MKVIELTDPESSERAIRAGQNEDVVVLRDGVPVALVVPFDEDDVQWYARERDPRFLESIARARQQVREGRGLAHEDLKSELGLAD